jgi:hypothetical protein
MADLTRQAADDAGPATEDSRERTIDSLLVKGLDLYFAGDCDRAIHAWTRVLFLDRTHARARAYIERARTVLAERQRETDELLHRGLAALDAGDTDRARSLLASAVERGGPVEAAEVALERLGRLDVAARGEDEPLRVPAAADATHAPVHAPRRRWVTTLLAVAAAALLLVAVALALQWPSAGTPATEGEVRAPAPPRQESTLPPPRLADLALRRARGLFARGHLHEALAEIDKVRADDPRRPEADRLQAEVQRALLDTTAFAPAPPRGAAAGRP